METWIFLAVLTFCLMLIFKRGFWFVVLTLSSLFSGIESLSNVMHLQLVLALGYFILMIFSWSAAKAVAVGYQTLIKNLGQPVKSSPNPNGPDWSPP